MGNRKPKSSITLLVQPCISDVLIDPRCRPTLVSDLMASSAESDNINFTKFLYFPQIDTTKSRQRGSGCSVIDDMEFFHGVFAYFFSRRRIVSKQRHCHIRQTICSTRFGVRVCLLVVWCKNF